MHKINRHSWIQKVTIHFLLAGITFVSIPFTSIDTFGNTRVGVKSTIPGAKYLGKSVNLLEGDNRPGSKSLIKDLSDSEIDSLSGGKWESNELTAVDVSEASRKYAVSLGLEGNYGAFSGSSSLKFSEEVKERTDSKIVILSEDLTTSKVSLKLTQLNLTEDLKKSLNDPNISAETLFADYGTHITEGVKLGGRIDAIFSSMENTKESHASLEVDAKARYGGITGSASYKKDTSSFNKRTRLNEKFITEGGNAESQAALRKNRNEANYKNWAASVEKEADFYAFTRITPIWKHADKDSRKKELEHAFKYIFTRKSLENISRFVQTGGKAIKPQDLTIVVPDDYKILSGGARVDYGASVGNLLTASYPEGGRTWKANQKDHGGSSIGQLSVYAMAVYDPFDMLTVEIFRKRSQEGSSEIKEEVTVKDGFKLVGGGSNVEYNGSGSLLTGSGPANESTWNSVAQTHQYADTFYVSSYAIGIKFKDSNIPYAITTKMFEGKSLKTALPEAKVAVGSGYSLVGGGAYTQNPAGTLQNFLTASYPDGDTWHAKSKDHFISNPAVLKVFAIGIKIVKK